VLRSKLQTYCKAHIVKDRKYELTSKIAFAAASPLNALRHSFDKSHITYGRTDLPQAEPTISANPQGKKYLRANLCVLCGSPKKWGAFPLPERLTSLLVA